MDIERNPVTYSRVSNSKSTHSNNGQSVAFNSQLSKVTVLEEDFTCYNETVRYIELMSATSSQLSNSTVFNQNRHTNRPIMHYFYLLSVLPALTLAAPALQSRAATLMAIPGQAILKNSCPYDVPISVITPLSNPTPKILQKGATYAEPMYKSTVCPSPGCGGVSIKASAVGGGPVT